MLSLKELSASDSYIAGVNFKAIQSFADDRGFFRELIRSSDPFFSAGFGQWSHSRMCRDTVKAWHFHHLQTDWWYVPSGLVHVVLFDNRPESPTLKRKIDFLLGDKSLDARTLEAVVEIPPGVLHGCRVLSDSADLFYITSRPYDPNDEGRFPFDSDVVPHSWGANAITVERDRKLFIPTATRVRL